MARKLPWDRCGVQPARQHSSATPRSPAPIARLDPSPAQPPSRALQTRPAAQRDRTPSTSPPPAAPAEVFMVDGLDQDDKYRMVEDELLAVAHTFTAHLHAAEYQRLKALARDRHVAGAGADAETGTGPGAEVGGAARAPATGVRGRVNARKRGVSRQRSLRGQKRRDSGDSSDNNDLLGDAPWAGTSLHHLMEASPHKDRRVTLLPLVSTAKGQHTGVHLDKGGGDDDDDDDDDDLDGPTRPSRASVVVEQNDDDNDDNLSDVLDSDNLLVQIRQRREREKAARQQQRSRKPQ